MTVVIDDVVSVVFVVTGIFLGRRLCSQVSGRGKRRNRIPSVRG